MPRLFFGLPLPAALRASAVEIASELRSTGVHASWVPGENLHYTVKFLGEIPAPRAAELAAQARAAAAAVAAFTIDVAGVGAFGGTRHPRVLWLGGRASSDAPAVLAASIDALAASFGVGPEVRPFRLHCTLARVRPGARVPPALGATMERLAEIEVGSFVCDALVLFESHLGGGPARYVPFATLPLGMGPGASAASDPP